MAYAQIHSHFAVALEGFAKWKITLMKWPLPAGNLARFVVSEKNPEKKHKMKQLGIKILGIETMPALYLQLV